MAVVEAPKADLDGLGLRNADGVEFLHQGRVAELRRRHDGRVEGAVGSNGARLVLGRKVAGEARSSAS